MDVGTYVSLDEDGTPGEVPLGDGLSLEDDDDVPDNHEEPQEVAEDDAPVVSAPAVSDQPGGEEVAEGLTIKEVHPAFGDSDDPEISFTTDIVHVAAICSQDSMRTLDELFGTPSDGAKTTELVFRVEMANLLSGDFTEEMAEQQAVKLLEGLQSRQSALPNCGFIFVAYDFGSLVVELALTLAARFPETYGGIATNTSRIIFSGCPQRALNRSAMELKLLQFLQSEKDKEWSQFVTLSSVHHLAGSVLRATERFIDSKMTLRSRIVSIYADEKSPGHIHALWDRFTATLGVPSEGLVQEQVEGEQRFPLLTYYTGYKVGNLFLSPDFLNLEFAFVSLAAPHRQSHFDPFQTPSLESALISNKSYTEWLKRNESRPLYVHGSSHRAIHAVSDQISLAWRKRMAEKDEASAKALIFNFDSADPLRDSMANMVASFILEAANVYPEERLRGRKSASVLQDWYRSQSGWTEKSSITILEALSIYFNYNTIFVLNDLDQCGQESRVAFLDYFSSLTDRCEGTFKVVITTRNPQLLHGEIHDSLELNADDYAAALDSDSVFEQAQVQLLARLGGSSAHKSRLEGVLKKLLPLDKGIATKLRFAQDHSEWPANPSFDSLNQFTTFIESVSPDDAPEETLDKTLRSLSEDEEFRWVLGWVISGYRPLSLDELSDLLRCHRGEGNWPASTSFKLPLTTGYSRQLKSWLRMLATFKDNRVTLRDEVRDIFDGDLETKSFTWTEVRRTAHQAIVEFCLTYLVSAEAQSSLESLFSRHLTRIGSGGHHPLRPTISIDADGEGILFYIVQALPFHLSRCPPTERTGALKRLLANPEDNPYTRWAEVYWAMSNPFSRTSEPPKSPLPILAGLDMLSYEDIKKAPLNVRQQCIVAAAGGQNSASMVTRYLRDGSASLDMPFLMSVLLAAVRGHNEQVALEVVAGIASLSEVNKTAIEWPESAIWAATWLDMDRFATAILSCGANPDPLDSPSTTPELTMTYFPGPLYLACSFGREAIVKVLIDHGASHHQLRNKSFGCLQAAASRGFAGVAKLLVAKDHSLLEARLPCSALYSASSYGSHKVVEALLELGADPDPGQSDTGGPDDPKSSWNPLVIACRSSYPRVVELLLRYKANPNCIGPHGLDTPLWYAAVYDPDPECVRLLLEHGADPNHELLSPPLIMELEYSHNDENAILEVCRVLRTVGEQPIDVQAAEPLGRTALMRTAYRGRMDLLRWLLDNGADVNALDSNEECALHFAAEAGQVEAARELVRRGARLDIGRSSVLMAAMDHPEIFRLLLDAGANPDAEDSYGNGLINLAVVGRKVDVVKMLIEKKANINHPDSSGWPPVFDAAVYMNDASLTRLLVDGGADLTGIVNDWSLLHHAVVGPPEIMKILLEFTRYLKVDTLNSDGNTALVSGSLNSSAKFECLKSLVYAGADVNAKERDGETALHSAVRSENDELLSLLLAQPETDIDWAGSYGTALQIACRWRMIPTVRALLDKGARINQVTPKCINSTPLVAALRSAGAQRDQDSEQIDRLVRELVARGADVRQAVRGNVFYTALSAACLGAGAGTINFLLDEGAAADVADPVFGRLPLHFAAMNGLENLRTILLAFRGSLLHPDGAGKTSLHWAAQYGNASAVGFILASKAVGEGAVRTRYVNQRDEHGWTPLCWAVRELELIMVGGMRSETANHAAVVRVLLENGADAEVECQLGNGETMETLTVLDLARRSAGDEVIGALTKHIEQRHPIDTDADRGPVRRYQLYGTSCDICLSRVLGYRYHCTSCLDYDVCTTCLPTVSKYHNGEVCEDGLPHAFERKDGDEYQDPPAEPDGEGDADAAPPSPRPSSPGGVEPSGVPDNEEGAEEVVLNDLEADLALEDEEEEQEAK